MNTYRTQRTDISNGRKPYHLPPNILEQGHPAYPPLAGCPVAAKEKAAKEHGYTANITRKDHFKKKICGAMRQLSNALEDESLDEAALGAKVLDTAARLAALAFIMNAGTNENASASGGALDEIKQRIDAFSHRPLSACEQNTGLYPRRGHPNYFPANIQGNSHVY